jgi:uncharacterized membrane protein
MAEARSGRPKRFFTAEEEVAIVAAIEAAERRTSAEIRVHLEHRCPGGDPLDRARRHFEALGMTATAERNGVLVYLATGDRLFAVAGDRGIHEVVPEGFWDEVTAAMAERFREDDFAGGLERGLARIGEKLAGHFPHAGEADRNELPDAISRSDEESGPDDPPTGPAPPAAGS